MKQVTHISLGDASVCKFDFEIGCLVKSPCRECVQRKKLPGCAEGCEVLNKIQMILSKAVSCTRNL
ncbi:MAG: hypothetical protein JRH18_14240 [Deltaproteobacteria bacterium]|nr:hypothetical protein [Deltaproteobacteria bacterium]MBW1994001.1 hypothetical protein [Deltaproteobacteria bacterium]MBW2152815.1 hypothetical protein [Deltaproteobacteria bacterium]